MSPAGAGSRRRLWWFAAIGVVLPAIWLAAANAEALLRERLQRELSLRLAMPVALAALRIEALATRPSLTLGGLRLGAPEGALLSIDSATLEGASARSLLTGRIERIAMRGVVLRVDRLGDGTLNLAPLAGLSGPPREGSAAFPEIRVEDLRLRFEPSLGAAGELALDRLQLTPGATSGEFVLAFEGRLSLDAPLAARGEFSGQARWRPAGTALIDALAMRFAGELQGWRADSGRLEIARMEQTAAGDWSLSGVAAAARLERPTLALALVAVSVPAAQAGGGSFAVPALGIAAAGHHGEVDYAGSLGLLDLAGSVEACRARFARIEIAANAQDGSAVNLRALGPIRSVGAARALRGEALALDLSLSNPAQFSRPLRLTGLADFGVDPAGRSADWRIDGQLDRSQLAIEGGFDTRRQPPLAIRARVDRLDLDAYADGSRSATRDATDWTRIPLALDIEVGRLRRDQVELRDARLRYRPAAAQRRAE